LTPPPILSERPGDVATVCKEGAHVAVADMNRASADDTVQRIMAEGPGVFDRRPTSRAKKMSTG
jgi:hypothetical protein